MSMVVDGEQVASVLLGEHGAIEAAHGDLLCVDMSTIAPVDSRRIAAALGERGVRMLDAPVTGSSPRAEAGTLTIMAGGAAEDFARAQPIFAAMGEVIVHVGELGQGEMLKLINNSLGAANAAALAEALLLARATGVDLDAFVQVTSAGSGASAQLTTEVDADARARLHDAVQDRAHAQGRAPVPRGSPGRGHPLPLRRARARPAHRHARAAATARTTTPRSSRPPRDSPGGDCSDLAQKTTL